MKRHLRLEGLGGVVMHFHVLETRLQVGVEIIGDDDEPPQRFWDCTGAVELPGAPEAWLEANLPQWRWKQVQGGGKVAATTRTVYILDPTCVAAAGDDMDRFDYGTIERRQHRQHCWRMRGVALSPVPADDVAAGNLQGFQASLVVA